MDMGRAPHLQEFLRAADYFEGLKENPPESNHFTDPRGQELWNLAGVGSNMAWCAAFVSACAQKAGIANIIIAKNSRAPLVAKNTVELYGGTWIDGPLINGKQPVIPQPGDLITFGTETWKGHDKAKHIGIVTSVDDKVHTIEGNTGEDGICKYKEYAFDCDRINLYVRPDWSRVGDILDAETAEEPTFTPLYNNYNDRHDMTLRQVCYLDGNYNLSDAGSGIAISAINYTTMLGTLYDSFAPAYASNISIDTSLLTGNEKIAIDYFLSMVYPASSACAMAGCLYAYSRLNTQFKYKIPRTGETRYGIGAWNGTKLGGLIASHYDELVSWDTDLSHQLSFFLNDLYNNYRDLFTHIKTKSLGLDAVNELVDEFMPIYNPEMDTESIHIAAKEWATQFYNNLIILEGTVIGDTSVLTDINGNQLHAQFSVDIPPELDQTGLLFDEDYTSYTHWFYGWGKSTDSYRLSRVWESQGCCHDNGVATIGGYYCVAVKPKFGTVGDVMRVTLKSGASFNCIMADTKGGDAKSEWGHSKSDKDGNPYNDISIIEWERVKTDSEGRAIKGKIGSTNIDKNRSIGDWYKQPITNITNYGKYCAL